MQLKDIAWQSLKRRRARFAFMLAALALGSGTVVALTALSGAMQREIGDELDRFGANIVITPKTRAVDLAYGGIAVAGLNIDTNNLASKDGELVRTIPNKRNISAVAPKLLGTTLVNDRPALVIGAIFREERRMKTWWNVEGEFADGSTAAIVGSELARELGVVPGGVVKLGGRQLTVAGVLAPTGTVDDEALFADLPLVQDTLGRPGAVSVIEVSALCRGCPIDDIVAQISAVLPNARVAPIAQAVAARERTVQEFTRFAYAISVIVLFVGLMVVLTTMMGSVVERTQEIGVLRAIGFRQTQIATILLLESTAITVAGGVLGWAAGTATSVVLGPLLAALSEPVHPSGSLAFLAVGIALVVGASGSAYPAWRAARMNPADALRHL